VTVLVVDHEFANREAAVRAFTELGARVIAVDSGDRALQILRAEPAIALLFIKVELPGMGGTLLAALARRTRPGLSIALTSSQPTMSVPPLYHIVPMPWSRGRLAELLSQAEAPEATHVAAALQ
jgi:CheY-like chemotaxis protein